MVSNLAAYYVFIMVLSKKHIKNDKNPKLMGHLEPFKRIDVENWRFWNCFPMVLTFWPRFLLAWFLVLILTIWVVIFMTGADTSKPLGSIRKFIIRSAVQIICRSILFTAGLVYVDVEYVNCDYTKYLGPNWKPSYTGAGTIVSNHISWMDIVYCLSYFFPSFLSKKSVQNIPGVGRIATAIDCVFLDRAGTKEEKIAVGKAIEQR